MTRAFALALQPLAPVEAFIDIDQTVLIVAALTVLGIMIFLKAVTTIVVLIALDHQTRPADTIAVNLNRIYDQYASCHTRGRVFNREHSGI